MEKYPKHSIKLFNLNTRVTMTTELSEILFFLIKLLKKMPMVEAAWVFKFITIEQRYKESPKHLIKLQGGNILISLFLKIIVIKRLTHFHTYIITH